ncbi:hypothetical protein KBY57_03825 [Cyanobium sp. Aljojuca 7D2]|jgi:hypothetical protein|uniref:hypothetical protein n=1 Tax=Cyanobium sp. Aljojuca 7D2 TaxID=2823698 RepID=UPI0020CC4CFA|nr:hypothetical protein [Cyanobium sp. Aljojuca 7D2]MCP9890191.1 hypothetical protein [Cyanobium sp. Aljojuca 7D2]
MATDPLDALRLTLMQDVLPVGLAVVERARKGGAQEVMAAFDGRSDDPLGTLRQEGEPAASELRQGLDRVRPGLGNPVMKVEVHDVAAEAADARVADPQDALELQQGLARIAERLEQLEQRLGSPESLATGSN